MRVPQHQSPLVLLSSRIMKSLHQKLTHHAIQMLFNRDALRTHIELTEIEKQPLKLSKIITTTIPQPKNGYRMTTEKRTYYKIPA